MLAAVSVMLVDEAAAGVPPFPTISSTDPSTTARAPIEPAGGSIRPAHDATPGQALFNDESAFLMPVWRSVGAVGLPGTVER